MQISFTSLRRDLGRVAFCLLGVALLAPATASAGDFATSPSQPTRGEGAPASSHNPVDPSPVAPHWTFSAETTMLSRAGGGNQALVALVPGAVPWYYPAIPNSATYPGVEALNSNQLWQGLAAGPKLGLTYNDDSGHGFELSYFDVLGLSAAKSVDPGDQSNWLVMKAPGTFWQTQDYAYQAMAWRDVTSLYSLEANGRLDLSPRVSLLAGLRWLQLNDELKGTLTPSDLGEPTWKYDSTSTLAQAVPASGAAIVINPPFWTAKTTNNLYGVQIGVAGELWTLDRLSLDGALKAGVYDNAAEQSALVSMQKRLFPTHAATNTAAFVGEAELQAKYRLTDSLAFKIGYQALWMDGVALAPRQIQQTYTTQASASALGVDHSSNALFQGVTLGVECSF